MASIFSQGHAVVIGAGGDLRNTVDDAKGLAGILIDEERCAYPSNQVLLRTAEAAKREGVLNALGDLATAADNQSTVIVYFSGHGYEVQSAAGPAYYLMPNGYDTAHLAETAISGAEFTERLAAIPAKKLLVLLDCCHAGGITDLPTPGLQIAKAPVPQQTLDLLAAGGGRALIASSRATELSYAGVPYSAFTLALIEALSGEGASKQDGFVRLADLALYARERVVRRTASRQHPILEFTAADNWEVAYYAAGGVAPKGLSFAGDPEIEPYAGAWTVTLSQVINLSGQTVQGNQIVFGAPVTVQGGFFQPGWQVQGGVTMVQGNFYAGGQPGAVPAPDPGPQNLAQLFTTFAVRAQTLPDDDQAIALPLLQQARIQAEKLQGGDDSAATRTALETRLQTLATLAPGFGQAALATLSFPWEGMAPAIRETARRLVEATPGK